MRAPSSTAGIDPLWDGGIDGAGAGGGRLPGERLGRWEGLPANALWLDAP